MSQVGRGLGKVSGSEFSAARGSRFKVWGPSLRWTTRALHKGSKETIKP